LYPRGLLSPKTGINVENEENIKERIQEIQTEIVAEKPEWMRIILKALEEQRNRGLRVSIQDRR